MSGFELYMIKSVLVLTVLYIFYWLVLKNEINFGWNRAFLIISIIAAGIFPLLDISLTSVTQASFTNVLKPLVFKAYFENIYSAGKQESLNILSIIYISGTVFFLLKFLSNIAKIHYLYFRFPKVKHNGFKVVLIDKDESPFTFFNLLFISRADFDNGNINEMIVHEQAHKDQYHSIDIVLLEIATIFQWFNPVIWLLRTSLKSEHEYSADNNVLKKGFDRLRYQELLFEKTLGVSTIDLTNNFNYSLLKKRFKMMTKNNNKSKASWKYSLSLPALILAFMLFSVNYNTLAQDKKEAEKVDVMAEYKDGGMDGLMKFIQLNLKYPELAQKNAIAAKIFVQFEVDKNGNVCNSKILRTDVKDLSDTPSNNEAKTSETKENANFSLGESSGLTESERLKAVSELEGEALRVVNSLGKFTPAQKDGRNVQVMYTFPIMFSLQ